MIWGVGHNKYYPIIFDGRCSGIEPVPFKEYYRRVPESTCLATYQDYRDFLNSLGFENFVIASFSVGKVTLLIEHYFFSPKRLLAEIEKYSMITIHHDIVKPKWWHWIKDFI